PVTPLDKRGPFWTPIGGPFWTPIDNKALDEALAGAIIAVLLALLRKNLTRQLVWAGAECPQFVVFRHGGSCLDGTVAVGMAEIA
ncbi:hypothetical protein HRV97_16215, partial [Sphingomonas sp. HHU CXW]